MSQRTDNPVATKLRRLAKQRQQLGNELQLIRRSVKGQSKSFSAIKRIDSRLKRLSTRLERVEKEGSRLVVKVGRALAHVRRSEILLSTQDLVELRALLGVADGRARAERTHRRVVPHGSNAQVAPDLGGVPRNGRIDTATIVEAKGNG